jgi:hypothetical protein
MAKINGSVSQKSDAYSFYIEWSESKASDYISTNITTVSATAYISCSKHNAWASGLAQKLVINGKEFTATKTVELSSGVTVALVSGSVPVEHNTDGTKSITISADCDLPDGNGYGPAWGSASGTATLTTIPRYMDYVYVSQRAKSINSISLDWSCSHARDWTQYSLNGGAWKDTGDTVNSDNKRGYFTVGGLNPNTTYSIRVRVRRTDSGLWSESTSFSATTYDIPRLTTYPNFNLGDSVTIKFSNPSGVAASVGLYDENGKEGFAPYRAVSGTSYTFNFTDDELDKMYKSMEDNTLKAQFYVNVLNNTYRDSKLITITLTGNQKTGHIKVNDSWKRAKRWINVNGTWKRCVRWINVNGTWRRCI